MSNTSIYDNKPHLNNDLLKLAVNGTSDYHYLMTAIVHESLMLKAGYIPDKIEEPLTYGNPHHWQSKAKFPNIGILWIFHAADCGHFTENEARRIWRYGQVLILRPKILKQLRDLECPADILTFADKALLNINDYIRVPNVGIRKGEMVFSAFNFSFLKDEIIKRELERPGFEYDLYWLIHDIVTDAGNWICGRDKEPLDEALNEFRLYLNRWRTAVTLV